MEPLQKKIMSLVMLVVALFAAFFFFSIVRNHGLSDSLIRLDKDWTVLYKDSVYRVDKVSDFKIPFRVTKGDTVVLESTLPLSLPLHPELRFKTYHSAVDIHTDRLVYSYGFDRMSQGLFVGSGIHYAILDPQDVNKSIRIRLIVTTGDAFSSFPNVDLISAEKSASDYNASHMIEMVTGIFLVLFGIISVLSSCIMSFWGKKPYRLLMIGFLSFLLGLWTLSYMKFMQAFSTDFAFNSVLEYFTLFVSPVPFGLLLIDVYKETPKYWKIMTLKIMVFIAAIFALVVGVLHLLNIAHCTDVLWIFHLFILVCFLFIAAHVLPYKKNSELSEKLISWGLVFFGVVAFADLLRYNAYKFFSFRNEFFEITWIPLGILIFVMLLLVSYLFYLKGIIAAKAEQDLLASMVYLDVLTGLFNRTKCNQVFEVLDKTSQNFAIVSVDMNGLKLVNDRHGHSAGDKLICAFADAFKNAFDCVGTTIRMGGDEFLAIIREEHLCDVQVALDKLAQLQKSCKEILPVPLEAAFGVAYRSDLGEVSADEVYKAADKKMYDMKMSMKSDLVRR